MAKEVKIRSLSPRQFLIKRINVYFGPELGSEEYPYSSQKSVLVREIQDNSADAIRRSKTKNGIVKTILHEDGSIEVYDNGPGIPVVETVRHDGVKASSLYLALGVLNAGGNYDNPENTIGTNGVGGSGAQMLSEYMLVEVYRDKKVYKLDFKDGEPGFFDKSMRFTPLGKDLTKLLIEKDNRPAEEKKEFPTGTKIRFKINQKLIKSTYPIDVHFMKEQMEGLSYLEPGFKLILEDNYTENKGVFVFQTQEGPKGLIKQSVDSAINELEASQSFTDTSVHVDEDGHAEVKEITKTVSLQALFAYSDKTDDYVTHTFVNTVKTKNNGIHLDSFEKAFVNVFTEKMTSMKGYLSKNEKVPLATSDVVKGLSVVISVNLPEPEFTAQIKDRLGGKKAAKALFNLYTEELTKWINNRRNADEVKRIADRIYENYKLRLKRKSEDEEAKAVKSASKSTRTPEKLLDCRITHDEKSELYIAEGDSAVTGLKEARNSDYQAILPVRGKGLNAMKTTIKKLLDNAEVNSIVSSLGAGVEQSFNIEQARYKRIILAGDADPDGAHIVNLLTALIWKLFPTIIEEGRLYRVLTPLYTVKTKERNYYCLNKQELEVALKEVGNKQHTIIRAKGLGETGQEALYDTAMNMETRRLQQVILADVEKALNMLEVVMGDDVDKRREWIESYDYKK